MGKYLYFSAIIIVLFSCNRKIMNKLPDEKLIKHELSTKKYMYKFMVKMDVSDLDKSSKWYTRNFALTENFLHTTPEWKQFSIPGVSNAEIGLKLRPGSSSGGVNLTFIVADIRKFRNRLIENGVHVDSIKDVGEGVQLAFLTDLDSNRIVLRQEC